MNKDYQIHVDSIDRHHWSRFLGLFSDASIYQSWAYGAVRWKRQRLSHVIVSRDGEILAAAQLAVVELPVFKQPIAYISRGPMFIRTGAERNLTNLRLILDAIKNEYLRKRNLPVRLVYKSVEDMDQPTQAVLRDAGFNPIISVRPYSTLLLDLSPSIEQLRANLHKKWREKLNRVQRQNVNVVQGTNMGLYQQFCKLYYQMYVRKKFVSHVDIDQYAEIQKHLPAVFKMKIMICYFSGKPVAALVWSDIGRTGLPIFSATADAGLKMYGSYLLRWKMVEQLKEKGCRFLDQGGVDPVNNSGGYRFKEGMGGKRITRHQLFYAVNSKPANACFRAAEKFRDDRRRMQDFLCRTKKRLTRII